MKVIPSLLAGDVDGDGDGDGDGDCDGDGDGDGDFGLKPTAMV